MSQTHQQIKYVREVQSLLTNSFTEKQNCIVCERDISNADFDSLASEFWQYAQTRFKRASVFDLTHNGSSLGLGKHTIKDENVAFRLVNLTLLDDFMESTYRGTCPAPIENAFQLIHRDFNFYKKNELRPQARFLREYAVSDVNSVDVNGFHIDRMGWKSGRFVAPYNKPTTEWVRNEDVITFPGRHEVRVSPNAKIHSIKPGSMIRSATMSTPGTSPFVHRGAKVKHTQNAPRVMTIAHIMAEEPK